MCIFHVMAVVARIHEVYCPYQLCLCLPYCIMVLFVGVLIPRRIAAFGYRIFDTMFSIVHSLIVVHLLVAYSFRDLSFDLCSATESLLAMFVLL